MQQFQLKYHQLTLTVKRPPVTVLLLLYLFTFLCFALPLAGMAISIIEGSGILFANIIALVVLSLIGYQMLRVTLWNHLGREIYALGSNEIVYTADYHYFKGKPKIFSCYNLRFSYRREGYDEDLTGVLEFSSQGNEHSSVIKMPVGQLETLIEKLTLLYPPAMEYVSRNVFPLVEEKLAAEHIASRVDGSRLLFFLDQKENYINEDNIAVAENKLAWFQTSNADNHLLRIFENGKNFNWIPITYNQSWNCDCFLLEWFRDHLIFIYKEKHETYICAIRDEEVRHFHFHGEALERKGDTIYYEEYTSDKNFVKRLRLPELEELSPVTAESLRADNLLPKSDVFFGGYLRGK